MVLLTIFASMTGSLSESTLLIYILIPAVDRMLMNQTNHTEDDLFSCYSPSVVGYHYFTVLWGCVVTITGTAGNLMTILAFALDSHLKTRFNVLIVNLAVADLLYCIILQPMSVDSFLHLRWRAGQLWCQIFGLLLFLSNSVSIITLCLIAVSRYLLVVKRAVFDRVFSNHGLVLLVISSWALGLASFGPLWEIYVFIPQVCMCTIHRTRGRPYTTILMLLCFFVGLGCIGAFYLLIHRRVWVASQALLRYRMSRRSSRRKPASSAQGTDDSGVESGVVKTCTSEMSSQADLAQSRELTCEKSHISTQRSVNEPERHPDVDPTPSSVTPVETNTASTIHSTASGDDKEIKQVTRMCLTVFMCFVCCFVPFLLFRITNRQDDAPTVLQMFCSSLTWLNSCINPLLYAIMNRQFRQAYRVLLTRAAAPFTCFRVHTS